MKKVATLYVGALVSLALGFGCASDPAPAGSNTNPVIAGTPGSTAGRPAAGTGASGSGAAAAAVQCGATTCPANPAAAIPAMYLSFLPGAKVAPVCCFDMAAGTCSFVDATGACAAPVVAEPRCPAPNIPGGIGGMTKSCCKADGNCAYDLSGLSLGCSTLSIPGLPAMTPQRCDGTTVVAGTSGGAAGATVAGAGAVAGTTAAGAGALAGVGGTAVAGASGAAAGASGAAAGAGAVAGAAGGVTAGAAATAGTSGGAGGAGGI